VITLTVMVARGYYGACCATRLLQARLIACEDEGGNIGD